MSVDAVSGASPLKWLVLSLLLEKEGHGYDLTNRINRRVGPAWRLRSNDVYRPLEQLEDAGLVRHDVVLRDSQTGTRKVFSPTERADAALTEWMRSTPRETLWRAEVEARVSIARVKDIPALLERLTIYEGECVLLMVENEVQPPQTGTLAATKMKLARRSAAAHLKAELDWIVEARRELSEFLLPSSA